VLDGASALIAGQRPVLMIELVEAFNRACARLANATPRCRIASFFSKGG